MQNKSSQTEKFLDEQSSQKKEFDKERMQPSLAMVNGIKISGLDGAVLKYYITQ